MGDPSLLSLIHIHKTVVRSSDLTPAQDENLAVGHLINNTKWNPI
jgi:hypothetical protein